MTGHSHGVTATGRHRRTLIMVLALTTLVAVAEVIGAVISGSLVLLADAAHMAADAAGLGLSLLAAFVRGPAADREADVRLRQGRDPGRDGQRGAAAGHVGVHLAEAIRRLVSPADVSLRPADRLRRGCAGGQRGVAAGAAAGQAESLNIRGAFLEVASDALGAAAVIVTGVIIATTGFTRADPIASLLVGLLILPRTWRLLRDAVDVLLEASPRGIDLNEVRPHMTGLPGVRDVHDLHAWTITSGLPGAVGARRGGAGDLADGRSAIMLDRLQDCLRGHFDVEHSTFQLEPAGHAGHEHPMHD